MANLSHGVSSNPQAYDELKKRLLSEYKKLTKQKGTAGFEENRDRLALVGSSNQTTPNAPTASQIVMQKAANKATAKKASSRHQAEGPPQQQLTTAMGSSTENSAVT